jgi:hypothetical protein
MKLKSSFICTVLIIVALSAVMCFPSGAAAQERKITVKRSELPDAIVKAIQQAVTGDVILVKIEKEVEGEDPGQYDVEIRSGEKLYEVEISPQGEVIEVKDVSAGGEEDAGGEQIKKWTDSFNMENCTFATVGGNRFFSLEPGHQLVLQSDEEKVVITVLDQTKMIGGIRTRIIEEREEKDGELAEVSRNFFAVCKEHGDVFYFGEEVDDYKDGRIVAHGGAWRADEPDSKAGIIMPGTILLGARHYQEISPKAMDRAEIIADDVTMKTPAGTFKNCIRVEETSGLDPDEECYKTYAPGVGIIQDEDLLLVRYGKGVERTRSDEGLVPSGKAIDDFDDQFSLDWDILNADPSHWSLSKVPGTLTITTQEGAFVRGRTDYRNIFLVDCPARQSRDFQVTTCLKSFKPVEFWNSAGLVLWDDEDNNLIFVYGYGEGPPVHMTGNPRQFTTRIEMGGSVRHAWFRAEQEPDEVWLRVVKRGTRCELYTSADGKTFHPVELILSRYGRFGHRVPWPRGSVKRVGFYANNGGAVGAREVDASFDFFEVRALSDVASAAR